MSVTTIQRDLENDKEKHYFAKNDIFVNLKLYGPNPETLLDPTYFNLKISQASYHRDYNKYGVSNQFTDIPFEYCGDNVPQVEKDISDGQYYTRYICLKTKDFYVRSNSILKSNEAIEIDINKCTGASWKSDAEIQNILSTHFIDLGIVSNYFDFNDYTNPVHPYLQDLNYL